MATLKEKGAKKSIEELYNAIFAIREALQDATQLAAEAAVIAEAFGGEISRVITSQINQFFIPAISKYIDNEETPGAMSPLVTFLDSVPLAMTRQPPEPEQTAPAPIKAELTAPPATEPAPAEGSYAAQRQESKKVSSIIKEALEGEQYNVIRKIDGMEDDKVFTGSKEEAEKKADWLNRTLTTTELDDLEIEYIVKPCKLEGQKDVSKPGELPKVKEAYSEDDETFEELLELAQGILMMDYDWSEPKAYKAIKLLIKKEGGANIVIARHNDSLLDAAKHLVSETVKEPYSESALKESADEDSCPNCGTSMSDFIKTDSGWECPSCGENYYTDEDDIGNGLNDYGEPIDNMDTLYSDNPLLKKR